jgi:hypothetical protein
MTTDPKAIPNIMTSPWACNAWGDGSSAVDDTNVTCPECEVVIASALPIEVAVHIAGLHNAALAQPRPEQVEDEATCKQPLQVAVKPLEWSGSSAECGVGTYIARKDFDLGDRAPWDLELDGLPIGSDFPSLREAKAAAQSDYEIRIRSAVARPAPKPAGDADALMRAVRRAEDGAGTMPAKDAVKLRPADWHAVCDAARKLASPAPAEAASASVVSHEPPERETQHGLRVTHETQAPSSEREGA